MKKNGRGIVQNCGCELGRPYLNDQTFIKMYKLPTALKNGTLFPELFLMDSEMYNAELYKNPKNRVSGKK
ncbi:MAG: spore coat associated protein CotJA [Peptostreptococcaceae bacterium]